MSGGETVSWGSKLQEVVGLSSTKAEYVAICHAMQEGLYLTMLQTDMGIKQEEGGNAFACRQSFVDQACEESL